MGEAYGSCAEGRAVLGTRQKKIQRKSICATLNEPPDADPHVRWCERGRLAAAPYSISGTVGISLTFLWRLDRAEFPEQ